MRRLAAVLAGLFLVAVLFAPAANGRGGNHGCDQAKGSMYSNHFFAGGDGIVVGTDIFTPVLGETSESMLAQNKDRTPGSVFQSSLSCGADPGDWRVFSADLGPGDDSVRMDGEGWRNIDPPHGPLVKRVKAKINGGPGKDRISGHSGLDVVKGGGGADVIDVRGGGKDRVDCGPGRDRVTVDGRDRYRNCERVVTSIS